MSGGVDPRVAEAWARDFMRGSPLYAPRSVPATSREAHRRLNRGRRQAVMRRALAAILRQPGTAKEIAARLGGEEYAVERRVSDLKRLGLVAPVGTRANPSGRPAEILAVVSAERARAWLGGGA